MRSGAYYVAQAKVKLGYGRMSDRELGVHLGCSQSLIAQAKHNNMGDPLALKLAHLLGIDAGEILLVARAEREKDARVKSALLDYVGKVLSRLPAKALSAVALLVAGGMMTMQPLPAEASVGGAGRSRKR